MDCSLPGSSVCGISQARILAWIAISFSRGASWHGLNPRLLHWQVDSLPLSHQGSPMSTLVISQKKNKKTKNPKPMMKKQRSLSIKAYLLNKLQTLLVKCRKINALLGKKILVWQIFTSLNCFLSNNRCWIWWSSYELFLAHWYAYYKLTFE